VGDGAGEVDGTLPVAVERLALQEVGRGGEGLGVEAERAWRSSRRGGADRVARAVPRRAAVHDGEVNLVPVLWVGDGAGEVEGTATVAVECLALQEVGRGGEDLGLEEEPACRSSRQFGAHGGAGAAARDAAVHRGDADVGVRVVRAGGDDRGRAAVEAVPHGATEEEGAEAQSERVPGTAFIVGAVGVVQGRVQRGTILPLLLLLLLLLLEEVSVAVVGRRRIHGGLLLWVWECAGERRSRGGGKGKDERQ
jgi:hypothetical protein